MLIDYCTLEPLYSGHCTYKAASLSSQPLSLGSGIKTLYIMHPFKSRHPSITPNNCWSSGDHYIYILIRASPSPFLTFSHMRGLYAKNQRRGRAWDGTPPTRGHLAMSSGKRSIVHCYRSHLPCES